MKIANKRELRPASVPLSMESRVVSAQPEGRASPERLQKGNDFSVVEGVQRLCGPVLALRRSGDIDDCHVVAADRWYRDYVLGVEGAQDPDARRTGKAPDVHAGMLARVAASERHSQIRRALGFCSEIRLRLMLVDELSFSAIAERLLPADTNGRKKIAAQMTFLLQQLAEHYHEIDQRRRGNRVARLIPPMEITT